MIDQLFSFAGTIIGVLLGFQLNRMAEGWRNQREARTILQGLTKEIIDNCAHLAVTVSNAKYITPELDLKTESWEVYKQRIAFVGIKDDLVDALTRFYFETKLLSRTINLMMNVDYSYPSPFVDEVRKVQRDTLLNGLQRDTDTYMLNVETLLKALRESGASVPKDLLDFIEKTNKKSEQQRSA